MFEIICLFQIVIFVFTVAFSESFVKCIHDGANSPTLQGQQDVSSIVVLSAPNICCVMYVVLCRQTRHQLQMLRAHDF
jgi:hypothetical protein